MGVGLRKNAIALPLVEGRKPAARAKQSRRTQGRNLGHKAQARLAFSASRRCGPAVRPDGAAGPTMQVDEVLDELHGLAVRAQERPTRS